jgi:hypothetical protein
MNISIPKAVMSINSVNLFSANLRVVNQLATNIRIETTELIIKLCKVIVTVLPEKYMP